MIIMLVSIAVACLFLIGYSYLGYPLLLQWLTRRKALPTKLYESTDELPDVYILMSAFNEEKVIQKKLNSVYNTDYPLDKIHFYIGSDASTDQTNQILSANKNKYSSLHLLLFEDRNGKAKVLNRLADALPPAKSTDIVVLTDANVLFERDTLFHLIKYFKDKTIGQVGANIVNYGFDKNGIATQEAFYIQRENKIKFLEGKFDGSMIGAFGACYAIRRDLLVVFPDNILMEDFYLSMSVLQKKYKAILALEAICKEDLPGLIQDEFKRKSRISAGNYQNIRYYLALLFAPFSKIGFCYWSHKLIRWFCPFLIILMGICLTILSIQVVVVAQFFLRAIALLSLAIVVDIIMEKAGIHFLFLRFIRYFLHMNLALLNGFIIYIKGVKTNVWTSTKRSDE